tara:strand:+ start:50 stop:373 length:324 start_codon:yes stop_codon:yes gene_type:complete
MENKEYFFRVSELFKKVESKLDEFEEEIDYDSTPDKLMVNIENNGSKIVINTQIAIKEIWLAGNSRGWHFKYDVSKNIWFASAEKVEFYECLSNLLSKNLGKEVNFS